MYANNGPLTVTASVLEDAAVGMSCERSTRDLLRKLTASACRHRAKPEAKQAIQTRGGQTSYNDAMLTLWACSAPVDARQHEYTNTSDMSRAT